MVRHGDLIEQFEIFDVPSPCVGVCQANNRGYCLGCFRSRDERFNWNSLSPAERKAVVTLCAQRRKRVMAKKLKAQREAEKLNIDNPQSQLDL